MSWLSWAIFRSANRGECSICSSAAASTSFMAQRGRRSAKRIYSSSRAARWPCDCPAASLSATVVPTRAWREVSHLADSKSYRRPRFQFTLTGLLVLMFVVAAATAPGYYLMRGGRMLPESRLVGMLMLLAGPLLLMTLLSVLLSLRG